MFADVQKYQRYVEHLDLSDEEKVELTRAVWKIVEVFADRAFRLDTAQLVTSGRPSRERTWQPPVAGVQEGDNKQCPK
jgi:hypothetical protein